jgi:hypothetical protein
MHAGMHVYVSDCTQVRLDSDLLASLPHAIPQAEPAPFSTPPCQVIVNNYETNYVDNSNVQQDVVYDDGGYDDSAADFGGDGGDFGGGDW